MSNTEPRPSNALRDSWALQSAASSVGFDWPDIAGVFDKVREEIEEIRDAWSRGDREQAKRELGDVLFASVNLARFLDADPSEELHRANERFRARFDLLKKIVRAQGRELEECTLSELDEVWEHVKRLRGERSKKRS